MDRRRAALPAARQTAAAGLSRSAADARPRIADSPATATTLSLCSTPTAAASAWSSMALPIPKRLSSSRSSAVLKDIGLYSGATVLGNADLALDPRSRRHRHESRRDHERRRRSRALSTEEDDAEAARLRIPAGRSCRAPGRSAAGRCAAHRAAPALAHRVCRHPAGAQLRGPVASRRRHQAASSPRREGNPEAQIVVVVCRDGNRHVGIAVSHVLDVAAGASLFEAGTSQRTDGVTLLKESCDGCRRSGRRPAAAGCLRVPATARTAFDDMESARGGSAMSHVNSIMRAARNRLSALVEVCSVRLGKYTLRRAHQPHSRNRRLGAARSPFPWRRPSWAAWSIIAAMCSPPSACASCSALPPQRRQAGHPGARKPRRLLRPAGRFRRRGAHRFRRPTLNPILRPSTSAAETLFAGAYKLRTV